MLVTIYLTHLDETLFPDARRFNPDRFADRRPDTYQWIPFGGGGRRCIGAAFAHMEMNVVLRTLLRDFTLEPTSERGERWHSRGIAFCPAKGGRAVVRRRPALQSLDHDHATAAKRLRGSDGQVSQAPHRQAGDDQRRCLGHRPQPGPAAVAIRLAGGDRGRRRGRLKATAKPLPGHVLMRVLDVRDAADQHRFAAEVRAWLTTPLAAVFNNAGVAVASSVLDADPGDDEWLRQVNFNGVVNGTRAFLPILVQQDAGVIVNTSSVFGLLGMPYQSAYCASKFAVRGFTDALRQELRGSGVSAVTVHPGGITTNIARNARIRKDPEGRGRSHEQMAADFEAITMTTPDKAAEIICRGIERGKARILVGPDAYVFDALARVAPTHYYDVVARLENRLQSRRAARR